MGKRRKKSYMVRSYRLTSTSVNKKELKAAIIDYDNAVASIQSFAIRVLVGNPEDVQELRNTLYYFIQYIDQVREAKTQVFDDGYNARKPHASIPFL